MAQVTISAKIKGDAYEKVKHLRESLRTNVSAFLKETVDDSVDYVNNFYAQGQHGHVAIKDGEGYEDVADAGNHDAQARRYQIGELTAELIAEGHDVLFFEYGAGDLTMAPYSPGSYSSSKGTWKYAKDKYWFYDGRLYVSVIPTRPVYNSKKRAFKYIQDHGKEVFEK